MTYEQKVSWACPGALFTEVEKDGLTRTIRVSIVHIRSWPEAQAVRKALASISGETERVRKFFSTARKDRQRSSYEVTAEVELIARDTTDDDLVRWGHKPR